LLAITGEKIETKEQTEGRTWSTGNLEKNKTENG
jgi:hypothetical protein